VCRTTTSRPRLVDQREPALPSLVLLPPASDEEQRTRKRDERVRFEHDGQVLRAQVIVDPRATIYGTLATTVLYVVALVAIVGVLSQAALSGSSAPFADAANAMWGGTFLGLTWGKWIALVAIAATLVGAFVHYTRFGRKEAPDGGERKES
jgi:hypothetical protein